MTLSEKAQSLINSANTKTGGTDTDLTSAVQTLINGYGSGSADPYEKLNQYMYGQISTIEYDAKGLTASNYGLNDLKIQHATIKNPASRSNSVFKNSELLSMKIVNANKISDTCYQSSSGASLEQVSLVDTSLSSNNFYNCNSIKYINIKLTTPGIFTTTGSNFYNCSGVETIVLDNVNGLSFYQSDYLILNVIMQGDCIIYVTDDYIETIKTNLKGYDFSFNTNRVKSITEAPTAPYPDYL